MNKMTLIAMIAGAVVYTGCAGTTGATTDGMQSKVEDRMQEKTTDKMLNKVGLPGMKKEKTTQEKLTDVATGKTSATDMATDMAVDKAADMALEKAGI